jgi:tetratricopeptide (TPR) repeat protein
MIIHHFSRFIFATFILFLLNSCANFNYRTLINKNSEITNEEDLIFLSEKFNNNKNDIITAKKIINIFANNNDCTSFKLFEKNNNINLMDVDDSKTNNFMAKCFIDEANFKKAINILNNNLSNDASNAESLSYIGLIFTLTNNLEESLIYNNLAIEQDPNNYIINNNYGIFGMYSKKFNLAQSFFEKALLSNLNERQRMQIINNLIESLIYQKKVEKALDLYLSINPNANIKQVKKHYIKQSKSKYKATFFKID